MIHSPFDPEMLPDFQRTFDYDGCTGIFTYRNRIGRADFRSNKRKARRLVQCNFRPFLAHEVAWLLSRGYPMKGAVVVHLNGDESDNRLANLTLVSAAEYEAAKRQSSNTGVKGVTRVQRTRGDRSYDYFYGRVRCKGVLMARTFRHLEEATAWVAEQRQACAAEITDKAPRVRRFEPSDLAKRKAVDI